MVGKGKPEQGGTWGGGKGQVHENVRDGTWANRQIISVRDLYTLDHTSGPTAYCTVFLQY
jgi:hypothetical protein